MLLAVVRLGFLILALFGIIDGIYELVQGSGQGVYDLGGGLMLGLFFLILTAYSNHKEERQRGVYYERQTA